MLLQLTTAVGAMMGTLCSLLAQGAGQAATAWILPFTAGGFIYIATVSVIPELLEDSKPFQSVKEIFAMIIGVAMMIVIAFYEWREISNGSWCYRLRHVTVVRRRSFRPLFLLKISFLSKSSEVCLLGLPLHNDWVLSMPVESVPNFKVFRNSGAWQFLSGASVLANLRSINIK